MVPFSLTLVIFRRRAYLSFAQFLGNIELSSGPFGDDLLGAAISGFGQ
jgi:hypothetical protein